MTGRTGPTGSVWLLWYALHMGWSYEAAMRQPLKLLQLMVAMQQVKAEGFEFVDNRLYNPETMRIKDIFPDLRC